jgi:DNA-binding MarR family transcriptional regulator
MSTPIEADADPIPRLMEIFPAFGRAFTRWKQAQIETTGLSPARFQLLATLHCAGPQMMSGLGDLLDVTPRNITSLVDALEGEKLVRRTAHPSDRRATVIELTNEGLGLTDSMLEPFQKKLAAVFQELTVADQRELLRLMNLLLSSLRKQQTLT